MLPEEGDVDAFLDSVSEVSRLIDGLKAGTLPPEYIDGKIAERTGKQQQVADAVQGPSAQTAAAPKTVVGRVAAAAADQDAGKQAELLRKVEELKSNRQRKLRAHELYQLYVDGKQQQQHSYSTDYQQWELWCPSDEEDDLFNSLTPNSPAFKAMEADISKRHARMVEQRQIAERQRQLGNAAFKAGQYSEALRCYEQGLEAQRHDMTLHANAAMAALKIRCYVAAQEHCDKVLHIAEVLHNTPKHPLCVKALQRRATAHQGLNNHSKAVADLQAARGILPGDAEVLLQLRRAETLLQEHKAAKHLAKLVEGQQSTSSPSVSSSHVACAADGNSSTDTTSDTSTASGDAISTASAADAPGSRSASSGKQASGDDTAEVSCLKRVKELVGVMQCSGTAQDSSSSSALSSACSVLLGLMQQPRFRLFFRECGGLDAASQLVVKPHDAAVTAAALDLLDAACDSDTALEQLSEQTIRAALDSISSQHPQVSLAAMRLAHSASICSLVRPKLGAQLSKQPLQQPAARPSPTSGALESLWDMCTAGQATSRATASEQQVLAMSLLSNCMLVPAVRTTALPLLQRTPQQLNSLIKLLASESQETSAKVLGLLSNMCNSSALRAELSACWPLMQQVVQTACSATAQQAAAAPSELQLAALGCLCNLALDPPVQQLLARQQAFVCKLLHLAADGPAQFMACAGNSTHSSSSSSSSTASSSKAPKLPTRGKDKQGGHVADPARAAAAAKASGHAATLLSRAAKQADAVCLLQQHDVLGTLSAAASAFVAQKAGFHPAAGQLLQQCAAGDRQLQHKQGVELGAEWLAAVVRTLALVTASSPLHNSCCSSEAATATITACCSLLRDPRADDAVRGNAALVLKSFAADTQEQWHPQMAKADAVAALVAAARAGRGSASSRNAGITLALLARAGGGVFVERLRELRGLEVLYEYVKP